MNQYFKNIKVLDLSGVLAGPSVAQFLGEIGCEVIKVENITTDGDVTRHWKLVNESSNNTSYFKACNSYKKSIALDIKHPKGLKIIQDLVKESQVVIASFKPGDDKKLKVDSESLLKIKPDLIYSQISGYGIESERPGYDAILQAECGFQYINGLQDQPTKMPVALIDVLTAHQLKEALLIALLKKEVTKQGSVINVSLYQSGISSLVNQATSYLMTNEIPQPMGSDHPSIFPYGSIFYSKDKKPITLGVGADRQFKNLLECLNASKELKSNEKYFKNANRVKHREELRTILSELFIKFDRKDILNSLLESKVPAGSINTMQEVFESNLAQEMVIRNDQNENVGLKQIAFKFQQDDNQQEDITLIEPPNYGQHTMEILKNLNYTNNDIENLKSNNIIS